MNIQEKVFKDKYFKIEDNFLRYTIYVINKEYQIKEEKTLNVDCVGYIIYFDSFDVVELIELGVLNEYRNMGYAKKLLKETLKNFNKKILLEVNENNKTAINIYLSQGFQKISTRKNYYQSQNAIIMEYK